MVLESYMLRKPNGMLPRSCLHRYMKRHQEVYLSTCLMYGSIWLIYILLKVTFNKQLKCTKIACGNSSTTRMQLSFYILPEHTTSLSNGKNAGKLC
uniref:Uncharacterized protein n=1 Tax=Arundo donax TaxID=35708 RepID=A0A0A9CQ04_ARUDO